MKKHSKFNRFSAVIVSVIMIFSTVVFASGDVVSVTYHGSSHSYHKDGSRPTENLHGIFSTSEGKPAFCAEHGIPSPMGDRVGNRITLTKTPYNSSQIRKILYYGYKGVEQWPGFALAAYNSVYKTGFAGDYASGKTESCGNAVTATALTKAYGGSGRYYNVSGLAEFEAYIASKPDPAGFTAILLPSPSTYSQDLFTWEYNPAGRVKIKKEVLRNSHLVNECPQHYSLAGAVYGVYRSKSDALSDAARVLTLKTKIDGTTDEASILAGKYFVREISAPESFDLDRNVYEVTVASGQTAVVASKDAPLFDPMGIKIIKKAHSGTDAALSLEGALYTVKYYREILSEDKLTSAVPYRKWVFKTDKNGEIRLLDKWKIGGDKLFKEEDGTTVGLYGTYTFEETKAPAGFVKTDGIISIQHIKPGQLSSASGHSVLKDVVDIEKPVSVEIEKVSTGIEGERITLSGAELLLLDSNKKVIKKFTSGDSPYVIQGLVPGKYYIREKKAPDGYIAMRKDFEFEVKAVSLVQHFDIFNAPVPVIKTEAHIKGRKNTRSEKKISVTDRFAYSGLVKGRNYIIRGNLIHKETGNSVAVSEVSFSADKSTGTIDVCFEFDGSTYFDGADFAVTEKLYVIEDETEYQIAAHENLDNMNQTVCIPNIKTEAYDGSDGDKNVECKGVQIVKDKVEYRNLYPGREYTIKGVLICKSTGKPLVYEGKEVTCDKVFVPETENGYVELDFTFSAEELKGESVVAFEHLYEDDEEIAIHADINDMNQTVNIKQPPEESVKSGDTSDPFMLIAVIAAALMGILTALKAKEETEEEE